MADRLFSQQDRARAKSFRGANDRAKISRILNAGNADEQGIRRSDSSRSSNL